MRLGVNIDHVATIRNARGGVHPDPVRAAFAAVAAGADGITAHLREDRRHITDNDIERLMAGLTVPLNLEMAATAEMQAIALRHRPHAVCLVPERREERTTEGGLDVIGQKDMLAAFIAPLTRAGIRVSLFIAPDLPTVQAARAIGAPVVELHTGAYAEGFYSPLSHGRGHPSGTDGWVRGHDAELSRLQQAATHAASLGLECHAGHGLTYDNVGPIAAIPEIAELNIGHFLIGEAIFTGIEDSIRRMRVIMDKSKT